MSYNAGKSFNIDGEIDFFLTQAMSAAKEIADNHELVQNTKVLNPAINQIYGCRNGQGGRPQGGRGPARDAAPRVWQPKAPAKSDNLSFEDMMSRFKSQSEEKMADLDHETNNRRGGGYAPRGRRGSR